MTYMVRHSSILNELLTKENGVYLKTLITTDFTNVCDINICDIFPTISEQDIEIINDTIKNIIIYESIKNDKLSNMLKSITELISHEIYLMLDENKISTCSGSVFFNNRFINDVVLSYNRCREILHMYNLHSFPLVDIQAVDNTYNHKLNRHFVTIGVYERE